MKNDDKILFAILGLLGCGLIYSVLNTEANKSLRNNLLSKLEEVADTDKSGEVDLSEASLIYEKIGVNKKDGVSNGLYGLSNDQIRFYFRSMGVYDPKTDNLSSPWLEERRD